MFFISLIFVPIFSYSQIKKPVSRAVIIGISDYEDENIPDLKFANRDAEEFAKYLKSKAGGSLNDEHIMLLTNENATYAKIYGSLDWLLEESQARDKVFIYFSGHGDVESKIIRQQGFLLTHNTPSNNYRIGSLRVEDVNAYLETLAQQNRAKVIVMTDACRSGSLAGGEIGVQATAKALATQFENTVKIMSCQANELSLEGTQWGGGRGVFSYHLIDGLTGLANGDGDSKVNLFELRRYLEDKVIQETSFSQTPVVNGAMGTTLSFVDPESVKKLKEKKANEKEILAAVATRGNISLNADTSILKLYEAFNLALENKNFLPSPNFTEGENSQSASELYDVLRKESSLSAFHGLMKRNFAAALQDEAQHSLNAYLKADPQEMAERWESYGTGYASNPKWLNKAAEVLGEAHPLHNHILSKQYYFEGVLLRLEGEKTGKKELFERALIAEQKALKLDGQAAYVYNELGLIYGNLNEKQKEIDHYLFAKNLAPTWVLPLNNLSTLYNNSGEYEKALKYGQSAIEQPTELASPLYNVGTAHWGLGALEKADSLFKICVQKDTNYYKAYNALGYLAFSREDYQEAEKNYKKAIEIKPDFTDAYLNFGILYHVMADYKNAEAQYQKLLELNPKHKWGHYNMICLMALQDEPEEAFNWMEKTLELGFSDHQLLNEETDLKNIKDLPRFKVLMEKYFQEKD